jgi:RsiW-degrading membrane proteinase PrsW (M82 family)
MTLFIAEIIGGLFIGFIWLNYLRQLDLFHTESWKYLLLIFSTGMLTPLFVLAVGPYIDAIGFHLNGNFLNDFLYSVFGIGFIEEVAKILPMLIAMMVFRVADEPIDYLIFASASALGFATTENIMYFHAHGSEIMVSRAILSALGHMVDTSTVAYAFVVLKFRKENRFLLFGFFLLAAALMHGIYDFFLISDILGSLGLVATILAYFVFIEIWATMNNNALNNSPHFSKHRVFNGPKIQKELLIYFGLLIAYQSIITFFKFDLGTVAANLLLIILMNLFILMVVSLRISRMKLVPGRWNKIRIRFPFSIRPGTGTPLIQVHGESFEEFEINSYMGKEFFIIPFSRKSKLNRKYRGFMEDKLFLYNDESYYKVRLEQPLPPLAGFQHDVVLLRARIQGAKTTSKGNPICLFLLMHENQQPGAMTRLKDLGFVEQVYLEKIASQ